MRVISRTMGPIARCIDSSWPVILESCLAEQKVWARVLLRVPFLISLLFFSGGTVYVVSLVSIIVPNHFPFCVGVNLLFSKFTTQPPALRSFITIFAISFVYSKAISSADAVVYKDDTLYDFASQFFDICSQKFCENITSWVQTKR